MGMGRPMPFASAACPGRDPVRHSPQQIIKKSRYLAIDNTASLKTRSAKIAHFYDFYEPPSVTNE
jgi:hypothetical protein